MNPSVMENALQIPKNTVGVGGAHHSWGGARGVWYVVAASLHASSVDQVGAAARDDVAAAHIHGDAHHAMRGHPTAGRGDHRGDVSSTGLRVKVSSTAALPVQLSLGVVGVCRSAAGRLLKLACSDVMKMKKKINFMTTD